MKYEYLKCSEKDFEGCNDGVMRIYRSDFGSFLYADIDTFDARWELIAERRPITYPVWDGAVLPPVGCECEIKRVADWMPVTIKFISKYHTVFTTLDGTENCYNTYSLQFRPLLSEADKKRDAAIKAIDDWLPEYTTDTPSLYHATAIYDAIAAGKIPGVKLGD